MTIGAIKAAAVVSATVAEPWATRRHTEIINAARITGIPMSESTDANASPIPEVRNIPPNMPPAPVTKITEQIGPKAFSHNSFRRFASKALMNTKRLNNNVSSRAIGV